MSLQRRLIPRETRPALSFSTNDYLGLAADPRVLAAVTTGITQVGWGSTGSRLLSGDRNCTHDLEDALAQFKHKPSALLFNSGYALNLGLISTLYGPDDAIFADRYCHASMIDGAKLSGAKLFRFAHQNLDHLSTLLHKHRHTYQKAVILTESVFSMDGDLANLPALIALKHQFNTHLIVDEAHALGVFGQNGEGCLGPDLAPDVDYIVGTLGKALGGMGGFVACNTELKNHLIQRTRSLIYSTALPPVVAIAGLAALSIIQTETRGADVQQKAHWLRTQLQTLPYPILGNSHIIPIVIGDEHRTTQLAQSLWDAGLDCPAIRHPTVPQNQARLRISLSWNHHQNDLDKLIETLQKLTFTKP